MEEYKTITGTGNGLYEEKRSSFIATAFHCETADEAAAMLSQVRAAHRDARHVVYAYSLRNGNLNKSSDDGEPHGTAGKPVCDIISGSGITDVLVTVVRYFGGVLLGTGGLVRAYSAAARAALENAVSAVMLQGFLCECRCSYQQYQQLLKLINESNGYITDTDFGVEINLRFVVPADRRDSLFSKINELFCGALTVNLQNELFFIKK